MTRYSAATVLSGLKDFQRRTVEHVTDRFYGDSPTRRFLVADETGLGKSIVARGVIAKTLEHLQDDDSVDRIDVIYVCSNQDIAAQNLKRLEVSPGASISLTSRLTMLALDSHRLESSRAVEGKAVNLVAFTPGTSFDRGWSTGKAEERALLFVLLEGTHSWDGWTRHAAVRALQGTVSTPEAFERRIDRTQARLACGIDRRIQEEFRQLIQMDGTLRRFRQLLDDIGRRRTLPDKLRRHSYQVVSDLRTCLARAGVETLEPDLVILDEFQRFRHLLSVEQGGESAELAQALFDYGNAKVLLLSATPYKPFTMAEESRAGDDHWTDFRQTLRFLCSDDDWLNEVDAGFREFREALERGAHSAEPRARLQNLLLQVMSRTERPLLGRDDMLHERPLPADQLTAADVRGYAVLKQVADALGAPVSLEYWKSAPYFLNFVDGYKLGEELRKRLKARNADDLLAILSHGQLLDLHSRASYGQIDLGNARMRRLAADTVSHGWWQLLWVPPSMPHYALGSPFAEAAASGMTKRLIFSSWRATPTAVAGLLSYEAARLISVGAQKDEATESAGGARLDYRLDAGRPGSMSTLAMFWPHPTLATLCDPLAAARAQPTSLQPVEAFELALRGRVLREAPADLQDARHSGEAQPWQAVLRWPGASLPPNLTPETAAVALGRASENADEVGAGLGRHVEEAQAVLAAPNFAAAADPEAVATDLVALGLHGPGNIAWRALGRLEQPGWTVTAAGRWRAAAIISSGLRSLFNRPESVLLIGQFYPGIAYWRAVLRYSAAGGLQAVIDEYLHHLRSELADRALGDDDLISLAEGAAAALSIRQATYLAFNPHDPPAPIPLQCRFALRYGGRRDDQDSTRPTEVRGAFNSPFWPFVLATTSAGQEGIDFHWWCSAVVHWNTPANPVDFEQREGRVNRFGGHAVRRNVAASYRSEALASGLADVWQFAYDAARAASGALGDFSPYWVYPGEAKIERILLPYTLSRDVPKLQQLKDDLALYRLALGQPRQEDLLAVLRRTSGAHEEEEPHALDLRPPSSSPGPAVESFRTSSSPLLAGDWE